MVHRSREEASPSILTTSKSIRLHSPVLLPVLAPILLILLLISGAPGDPHLPILDGLLSLLFFLLLRGLLFGLTLENLGARWLGVLVGLLAFRLLGDGLTDVFAAAAAAPFWRHD